MSVLTVFVCVNSVVPFVVIALIVSVYKRTHRMSTFILIPSLLYVGVFYSVFAILNHINVINAEAWRMYFRIGMALVLASLLVYSIVGIIHVRYIDRLQKELDGKC